MFARLLQQGSGRSRHPHRSLPLETAEVVKRLERAMIFSLSPPTIRQECMSRKRDLQGISEIDEGVGASWEYWRLTH